MGFDWKELVSKFKKHSRQFLHPCSFEPVLYISSKPETGAILPNMLDSERLFSRGNCTDTARPRHLD